MSKELRAFRKICKNINNYEFTDEYKKNKKLIETALKDYEELKKLKLLPYPKVNDEEYRRSVIKRLQAFEIIKDQVKVEVREIQGTYYLMVGGLMKSAKPITKEEYDLLKEVWA